MNSRQYPAKLILFGEYSSLLGSATLGIPIHKYFGEWRVEKSSRSKLDQDFATFLSRESFEFLKKDHLMSCLTGPPFYYSTIPLGYGLGSSGALSAAIYDWCKIDENLGPGQLRQYLAQIESFFHGTSSGFDPLISFLGQPLVRSPLGEIRPLEQLENTLKDLSVFIFDAGGKRSRSDLIPWFMRQARIDPKAYDYLVELNNKVVDKILENQVSDLSGLFKEISKTQLELMDEMILESLKPLWRAGIENDRYYLKICGAGGGGYYFIYVNEEDKNIKKLGIESLSEFITRS